MKEHHTEVTNLLLKFVLSQKQYPVFFQKVCLILQAGSVEVKIVFSVLFLKGISWNEAII